MSMLVALDTSEIASAVLDAIAPYLRRTPTEVHPATVVESDQLERASRPARQTFEPGRPRVALDFASLLSARRPHSDGLRGHPRASASAEVSAASEIRISDK